MDHLGGRSSLDVRHNPLTDPHGKGHSRNKVSSSLVSGPTGHFYSPGPRSDSVLVTPYSKTLVWQDNMTLMSPVGQSEGCYSAPEGHWRIVHCVLHCWRTHFMSCSLFTRDHLLIRKLHLDFHFNCFVYLFMCLHAYIHTHTPVAHVRRSRIICGSFFILFIGPWDQTQVVW